MKILDIISPLDGQMPLTGSAVGDKISAELAAKGGNRRPVNRRRVFPRSVHRAYRTLKSVRADIRGIFDRSYFRVWSPRFLDESQWFSAGEIRRLQLEGLQRLVAHARKNTAHYRNLPEIRSLGDLSRIPILTKRVIRENFASLRAEGIPGFPVKTGGTVSLSTTIKDIRLNHHLDFGEQRFDGWLGSPMRRVCELWGAMDIGVRPRQKRWRLFLPVESLKRREDALLYLERIGRFRPDLVKALPNPLRFLAHFAIRENRPLKIGIVKSGAETLLPEALAEIREAFGCEVFNFYASRELGALAQECGQHRGLHLNAERFLVEEVDGRLFVTDLLNYAMPLIRYENQDLGELSPEACPCGRGLPLLKSVSGRTIDFLLAKGGTWISLANVGIAVRRLPVFDWVEAFQYRQLEPGKITLLMKPWPGTQAPGAVRLEEIVRESVSPDELEVSIEIVAELALSPSGKQIKLLSRFSPWGP
jgi:phenylacetate-CoA ligase